MRRRPLAKGDQAQAQAMLEEALRLDLIFVPALALRLKLATSQGKGREMRRSNLSDSSRGSNSTERGPFCFVSGSPV